MATPALRGLDARFSGAEIDVLTGAWSAPALRGNPHVSQVLPYPAKVTPRSVLALARDLRGRHYDLGVGLDRSPLVNALLWLSGIPFRVGIDNQGRGVGLTRRVVPQPGRHETELFLDVVLLSGAPSTGPVPEYAVDAALGVSVEPLLPDGDGPLVVIHPGGAVNPGATMPSKRWPAESFATLASRMVRELGARLVLVGAASDRDAVARVESAMTETVTTLSDRLDLPHLAVAIARADVYVGNDSGVSHLAAAVGTPTVTIFGPTSPRRYRPLGPSARVCAPPATWALAEDVDLRRGPGLDPDVEITRVTPDEVFEAVRESLAAATVGERG
ncbi:MAG TPA: glycosyltransferase family 9 protein [Thermomicrobiaceae bacterium]|nr:glycosyltransferase family 9 protein [Thermomicrobiaceae bacterium]